MRRRLLNIASIICFVLCVALIGMWVRSEWSLDILHCASRLFQDSAQLSSQRGQLTLGIFPIASDVSRLRIIDVDISSESLKGHSDNSNESYRWRWSTLSYTVDDVDRLASPNSLSIHCFSPFGFFAVYADRALLFIVPYWFLILATSLLATVCQQPWPLGFNLRSLFFVMTPFAVVLGMIAWLDRTWIGK